MVKKVIWNVEDEEPGHWEGAWEDIEETREETRRSGTKVTEFSWWQDKPRVVPGPWGPEFQHLGCAGNSQPDKVLWFGSFISVQGETPLHTACRHGLANLTAELLQQGANPNLQTEEALPLSKEAASLTSSVGSVSLQTPLHMAIAYNHPDVVSVILEQKGRWLGITACYFDIWTVVLSS